MKKDRKNMNTSCNEGVVIKRCGGVVTKSSHVRQTKAIGRVNNEWRFQFNYVPLLSRVQILRIYSVFLREMD